MSQKDAADTFDNVMGVGGASSQAEFIEELQELCVEVKENMDPEGFWRRFSTRMKSLGIRLGFNRVARAHPLSRVMHKISVKYGSSVLGYYRLAAWSVNHNLFVFVFWLVWVIVPWFRYWESEGWEDDQNNTVLEWDEVTLNFLGANPANRTTDKTWFFYSGYPKKFHDYEMGLIYTVLCICTYTGALLGLTLTIGRQLKDSATPIGDMKLPVTVYAWDWQVIDKNAVDEKLGGAWLAIQAEYFSATRRDDYFKGQSVVVHDKGPNDGQKGTIQSIDYTEGIYDVSVQDDVLKLKEDSISPVLTCGARPATIRTIIGFTISFFLCMASLLALYMSVRYKEDMDDTFPLGSALAVKFINLAIPTLQRLIVSCEKIRDPSTVITQEVIRVFVIKMCGVILLFISIKEIESTASEDICPEFIIGAMFEQLIIVDSLVDILMTLLQTAIKRRKGHRTEFRVSTEIINTLYRQCLTWTGTPYCPMLPFVSAVCMVVTFAVKAKCMFYVCKTPSQPVSDEGGGGVYQTLLLMSLVVAFVPFFSFLKSEKEYCGPHFVGECKDSHEECETPLTALNMFIERMRLTNITNWMFSSIVLFVLSVLLLVIIYFLVIALFSAKTRGAKRAKELDTEVKHLQGVLKRQGLVENPKPTPSDVSLSANEYHALIASAVPQLDVKTADDMRPFIDIKCLKRHLALQTKFTLPGSMPDAIQS